MRRLVASICAVLAFAGAGWCQDEEGDEQGVFQLGRELPSERDDIFALKLGSAFDVKVWDKAEGAVGGSSSDAEVAGPGFAFGLGYEYAAWIVSVQFDATFTTISGERTASDDLFLDTADDVSFNGGSYERMHIPAGSSFDSQFTGATLDLTLLVNPFVMNFGDVRLTPYAEIGLLGIGGLYSIDAGDPASVVYSADGVPYVVGGSSSGFTGMGSPQVGPGLEIRIGGEEDPNHVIQAHVLFFNFMGDEDSLLNAKLSYRYEVPMEDYVNSWFVGLDARMASMEGEAEEGSTDAAYEYAMSSVTLCLGLTY